MSVFNEFPTALPFYEKKEMQNRFKENYTNDVFSLLVENDRLIPFQFRSELGATISKIELLDLDDNLILLINKSSIETSSVSGYQYFTWFADDLLKDSLDNFLNLDCGLELYLKVTFDDDKVLFSETFKVIDDEVDYFALEWRHNASDIDPVYYGNGFRNRMLIDTFITKGLPEVVVDTIPDGFGNLITSSSRMIVPYDFSIGLAPNFILIALHFMGMHDNITIRTKGNIRRGKIENVTVEQEQQETKAIWGIDVKFQQPNFYFAGSCETPILPPQIPEEIIIFTGYANNEFQTVYDANN